MAIILKFPVRPKPAAEPATPCVGNTAVCPEPKDSLAEKHEKAMRQKVQVAKRDLMKKLPDFTDAAYRYILFVNFGVSSSKELDRQGLHDLLLHFQDLGFKPTKGRYRETRLDKIRRLLTEMARREGLDELPWYYAMGILKKTKGGPTSFDKATPEQLDAVISALCRNAGYAKRKGKR